MADTLYAMAEKVEDSKKFNIRNRTKFPEIWFPDHVELIPLPKYEDGQSVGLEEYCSRLDLQVANEPKSSKTLKEVAKKKAAIATNFL